MALNQPTNIIPSELSGVGNGTVDVTQGLNVSWQINGDSPMTAYQINIYANDTASTQLYTTGKQSLSTPFYGTDANGNTVRFNAPEISASALSGASIANGNEYKIMITQWWSATDSITQTSASPFLSRSTPTLELNPLPIPITTRDYTFSAAYTQAQGDGIAWARWQIMDTMQNVLLDTGNVYTSVLQTTYDGFFTGETYQVNCTIQTQNGIEATTNWRNFTVNYSVESPTGELTVCSLCEQSCVQIQWTSGQYPTGTEGLSIYRREVGSTALAHVCDVPLTAVEVLDYGACSQKSYQYFAFYQGASTYTTSPLVSATITPIFWVWMVLECIQGTDATTYAIQAQYPFTLNVETGDVSNNNTPSLLQNFTPFPLRQIVSANYRSGTLQAYIGTVQNNAYSDSLALADAIYALSVSQNPKFLKTPKGELLQIETRNPISMQTNASQSVQAKYMSLPWVEVADAQNSSLVDVIDQAQLTPDAVVYTAVEVLWSTGELRWYTQDNYTDGSILSLDATGNLIQTTPDNVTPATMQIDENQFLSAYNGNS